MKLIYTAPNESAARAALDEITETWGGRYLAMIRLWEFVEQITARISMS